MLNKKIKQLQVLVTQAVTKARQAAELLIDILDTDKKTLQEIHDLSGISSIFLYQLEKVGRKQVIGELLFSECEAAGALMHLPYSEQVRLFNGSIEVLKVNAAGGEDVMTVKVQDMTEEQVRQVFNKSRIRGLKAQRTYIEGKRRILRTTTPGDEQVPGYEIQRKKLVVHGTVTFTKKELLGITKQL